MAKLLNKISNDQFFKVFSFNGLIVIVKLVTSFIISKVSAIYLGPAVIAHFVSYVMYYAIILLIFGSSLFGVDTDNAQR